MCIVVDSLRGLKVELVEPSPVTGIVIAQLKEGLEAVTASVQTLSGKEVPKVHCILYVFGDPDKARRPTWSFYVRTGSGADISDTWLSPDSWCRGLTPGVFAGPGEGILISFEQEEPDFSNIKWSPQCGLKWRGRRAKH